MVPYWIWRYIFFLEFLSHLTHDIWFRKEIKEGTEISQSWSSRLWELRNRDDRYMRMVYFLGERHCRESYEYWHICRIKT